MNFLGQDGLLYRFVNRLVDLIKLNIVFMVSCIPIFTIGTAVTAMYSITLKMCKNQEGYIVKGYFNSFKANFIKSTKIWLIFLFVFLVLGIDFFYTASILNLSRVIQVVWMAVFLIVTMIASYTFPQIAFFENSISNYLKNAFIMSMTRIGFTVPIVLLNLIFVFCAAMGGKFLMYGARVYIFFGWALIAFVNSFLFNKVFERYVEK